MLHLLYTHILNIIIYDAMVMIMFVHNIVRYKMQIK